MPRAATGARRAPPSTAGRSCSCPCRDRATGQPYRRRATPSRRQRPSILRSRLKRSGETTISIRHGERSSRRRGRRCRPDDAAADDRRTSTKRRGRSSASPGLPFRSATSSSAPLGRDDRLACSARILGGTCMTRLKWRERIAAPHAGRRRPGETCRRRRSGTGASWTIVSTRRWSGKGARFEGLRFFLDGSPVSVACCRVRLRDAGARERHCGPFFELVDQQFELLDLRLEFFRRAAERVVDGLTYGSRARHCRMVIDCK